MARIPLLSIWSIIAIAACGGGGDGGGGPNPSAVVIAKAPAPNGDSQTGSVAQPLADSFRVVVTDGSGPRAGITVNWTTTAAGAILSPSSSVTDANGRAASRLTMGTAAGSQTARAAIAGGSVSFTATGTPGPAADLTLVSGNDQAALTNTALAAPLRVRVSDQFGNVIGGSPVSWSVAAGSATVSAGTTNSASDGVASVTLNVGGQVGAIQARAVSGQDTVLFNAFGVNLIREVLVKNNFFESVTNGSQAPAVDTIQAGQAVQWVWQSAAVEHNIVSQGATRFANAGIASTPFTHGPIGIATAGTYNYECSLHAGMNGVLIVE